MMMPITGRHEEAKAELGACRMFMERGDPGLKARAGLEIWTWEKGTAEAMGSEWR